ncbi:MAG: helix-turn-helix domain-containing protein [Syntrophales bacterium]|nr:helix-turn-helix domain-containing protein [Syntrophales bacterium]
MLLTTQEAAGKLRRTKACLEAWRCRGGGPVFVKIGRGVFYREEDLENFIKAGRRTSTSQVNQ